MFLVPLKHNQSIWLFTIPNFITIIQLLAVQSPQPLSTTFLLLTQSDVKLWAYSDVSLELFPHPRRRRKLFGMVLKVLSIEILKAPTEYQNGIG